MLARTLGCLCVLFFSCAKHVLVKRPTNQVTNSVTISGSAYLIAPIAGAHVRATALSRVPPAIVADGVTQADGSFNLTVTGVDGDFLVQILGDQGGSAVEPVTGVDPIPLSQDDMLCALSLGSTLGDSVSVAINPWSTLVAVRSETDATLSGGSISDAYRKNVGLFSAHFGSASPWEASAVDLVASPAPGLTSSTIYSLAVIAMSGEALQLGARAGTTDVSVVNTLTMLRLLVADQSKDHLFDGKSVDQVLPAVLGNVHIDTETTRASLADALEDFLGSAKNQSGLTPRDVVSLLSAMRFDSSELYPGGSSDPNRDPTAESGAGPAIAVLVPVENQTLGATTKLTATIHDADGLASSQLLIDGAPTDVAFIQQSATDWDLVYLPAGLADGAHSLELDATDALGNSSRDIIHFSEDRTPPNIAFVSCDAPDDRARTVTTSASGVTYAPDTARAGCLESDLGSGAQVFYTFSDLALQPGAQVPTIRISVSDASPVASVTCQAVIDGAPQGSAIPCTASASPATHVLSVSSALFGPAIGNIADTSAVAIRVSTLDAQGNPSFRDFQFALMLLPAPLLISQVPPSGTALENAHFEAGTIDALFSLSTDAINLAQYTIENVSSRPVKLAMPALQMTGAYSADAYHTLFTRFHVYEDTSSNALACAPGAIEEFQVGSGGPATYEVCSPPVATTFSRGSLQSEINVTVAVASTGVAIVPDANNDVSLDPLTSYTLTISSARAVLGRYRFGHLQTLPIDSQSIATNGIEPLGEGFHGYYTGSLAASENGFTQKNTLWQDANGGGTAHQAYGYMSCDGWGTGNNSPDDPPGGLTTADLPLTGTFFTQRFTAQYGLPDGYVLGDLWLERRVKFASQSSWMPEIHLTTSNAMLAAKPDRSLLAFTSAISIEAPKPDLSGLHDSSFDKTLPGW